MTIELRRLPIRINLGKVFWKAVSGNKILQESITRGEKPMPVSVENFGEAIPIEVLRGMLPYMGSEKITEIRETEKIPVGIPIDVIGGGGYARPEISITRPIGPVRIRDLEIDPKEINLVYELVPSGGDVPFAAANIKWSEKESSLIYYVIEPTLLPGEIELLNKIKTNLIEKLDVDFASLRKNDARSYLKQKFEETVNIMASDIPEDRRRQILYFIERDFIGLDKIEALMKDPNIEDVSCDGISIPIFVFHRNPIIGSVKTNIAFNTKEELDIFVNKIAQRCGKNISVAQPIIGGTLPDGSRVQVTLGTDIARKGSNFTIRRFTERPLTPINLIEFKTFDPKIAAFLWLVVEYGRSILISGGVATGKTTLLNALSLFIKPELKIVSIEDTAELLLPHPHWVPSVARLPIAELEGKKLGEVDLFDLLRESLRQRPDYLIVGEVRGKEAYVLFQQIATGHASMSTIHADSIERLVDRLTTPPISLPATLIEALDIIIFIVRIKYGSTYVRRVNSVYEVLGFDRNKDFPIINEIFRWKASNDNFEAVNPSVVLKKITQQYGVTEKALQKEITNRVKVFNWMLENDIDDYLDVSKVIKLYYQNPEDVLSAI